MAFLKCAVKVREAREEKCAVLESEVGEREAVRREAIVK